MHCRSIALVVFALVVGGAESRPTIADDRVPVDAAKVDFTQWIQNRSYERFDYKDDGGLKTHQLIQFGGLARRGAECAMPVRVISFDVKDSSHIKENTELSLLLDCFSPHLVANILKFVGGSDRQHLEAKVIGDELAYPEIPQDGMTLPDLHFTARAKRGFFSVLGMKVSILVTERNVKIPPARSANGTPQPGAYEIHSRIGVKISVLGLSVKKAGFTSHLVVDAIRGLVEDVLEHDDGGLTVIKAADFDLKGTES